MPVRPIPAPLWIGLGALALITVATLFNGLMGRPVYLVAAVLDAVLLVGLYRGRRWAYVLTIVFAVLGTLFSVRGGPTMLCSVLVANGLVLLPVLVCKSYFFAPPVPPGGAQAPPAAPGSSTLSCSRCGRTLPDAAQFCPACGAES